MKKIITISREYGAGGRSIARRLAKELGVEFYDQEIANATIEESEFDKSVIEREEEERTVGDEIWKKISSFSSAYFNDSQDAIHEIQKSIILKLAAKGPCIIVGRCADLILQEAGYETLNVFIHADEVHRAVRVSELIGSTDANEIQKLMKQKDASRHHYYAHYSGKKWGDSHNYDISLDSGKLGYDLCAKIIAAAARETQE